jgi:hypothetical protein
MSKPVATISPALALTFISTQVAAKFMRYYLKHGADMGLMVPEDVQILNNVLLIQYDVEDEHELSIAQTELQAIVNTWQLMPGDELPQNPKPESQN